jgi:PAS domain S-box-containing protein
MGERAIIMADRDGIIRMWSAGAEQLFGHKAVDAVGASLDLIVPETHRARHWAGFRRAISTATTGDAGGAATVPVHRADGTVVRHAVRLVVLRDAWGNAVGAVGVFAADGEAPAGSETLPGL